MITILYPYRNRELERVKRSLDSLVQQTNRNFKVLFVDYGSKKDIAVKIKPIVEKYTFCSYYYLYTELQPWNKSKALNFAIKRIKGQYCFVTDVDMIFHPDFVSILYDKLKFNTVVYFRVGFLSEAESNKNKYFEDYIIKFLSNHEATGLSLLPVEKLKEIQGFDEFFHFWGAEDTDLHNRLKNSGCEVLYYDEKTLLLHQWHTNYRKRETKRLNPELQLTGIVEQNHLHLQHNLMQNKSKVNLDSWGTCMTETDYVFFKNIPAQLLYNEKSKIDYFLFNVLAYSKNEVIALRITKIPNTQTIKHIIKRFLGKKTVTYYDLKTINDLLLQQIISYHHHKPYSLEITSDLESIIFKIKT